MRTGRSLTVCGRLLLGVCVCLVKGGRGQCVPGPGGCLLGGGACAGGCAWSRGGLASQHALRQTPPPLWTESQMPVKTLPWPNFVVAGNKSPVRHQIYCLEQQLFVICFQSFKRRLDRKLLSFLKGKLCVFHYFCCIIDVTMMTL